MSRHVDYIVTLGVELEGGWNCRCGEHGWDSCTCEPNEECHCEPDRLDSFPKCLSLFPEADPRRDGSVDTRAQWDGEIACGPFKVGDLWPDRLATIWPNEVNDTCGMHVHLGCRTPDVYARFMTPAFEHHLIDWLKRWAREHRIVEPQFWSRIYGRNYYCQRGFSGDVQANNSRKSELRYRVCNYTWLHKGTLEIRVLPMFASMPIAIDAIREVLRLSNEWARTHRARQRARDVCICDDILSTVRHTEGHMVDVIDFDAPDFVHTRTEDLFTCA
jgi:hypothetical protein